MASAEMQAGSRTQSRTELPKAKVREGEVPSQMVEAPAEESRKGSGR
jgi:hypothetical protein